MHSVNVADIVSNLGQIWYLHMEHTPVHAAKRGTACDQARGFSPR
jgi:hypothetical protein